MSVEFYYSPSIETLQHILFSQVNIKKDIAHIFKHSFLWTQSHCVHKSLKQFLLSKGCVLSLVDFFSLKQGFEYIFQKSSFSFLELQWILTHLLQQKNYQLNFLFPFLQTHISFDDFWNLSYQLLGVFREYEDFFWSQISSWKDDQYESDNPIEELQRNIYLDLLNTIRNLSLSDYTSKEIEMLFSFSPNIPHIGVLDEIATIHIFNPLFLDIRQIQAISNIYQYKKDLKIYFYIYQHHKIYQDDLEADCWIKILKEKMEYTKIPIHETVVPKMDVKKTIVLRRKNIFANLFEELGFTFQQMVQFMQEEKSQVFYSLASGLLSISEINLPDVYQHFFMDELANKYHSSNLLEELLHLLYNVIEQKYSYDSIQIFLECWVKKAQPNSVTLKDLKIVDNYFQKIKYSQNFDYKISVNSMILSSILSNSEQESIRENIENEDLFLTISLLINKLSILEKSTDKDLLENIQHIFNILFYDTELMRNVEIYKKSLADMISLSEELCISFSFSSLRLHTKSYYQYLHNNDDSKQNSLITGKYSQLIGYHWKYLFLNHWNKDVHLEEFSISKPPFHLFFKVEDKNQEKKIFQLSLKKERVALQQLLYNTDYCFISAYNQQSLAASMNISGENEEFDSLTLPIFQYIQKDPQCFLIQDWVFQDQSVEKISVIQNQSQDIPIFSHHNTLVNTQRCISFLKNPLLESLKQKWGFYHSYYDQKKEFFDTESFFAMSSKNQKIALYQIILKNYIHHLCDQDIKEQDQFSEILNHPNINFILKGDYSTNQIKKLQEKMYQAIDDFYHQYCFSSQIYHYGIAGYYEGLNNDTNHLFIPSYQVVDENKSHYLQAAISNFNIQYQENKLIISRFSGLIISMDEFKEKEQLKKIYRHYYLLLSDVIQTLIFSGSLIQQKEKNLIIINIVFAIENEQSYRLNSLTYELKPQEIQSYFQNLIKSIQPYSSSIPHFSFKDYCYFIAENQEQLKNLSLQDLKRSILDKNTHSLITLPYDWDQELLLEYLYLWYDLPLSFQYKPLEKK